MAPGQGGELYPSHRAKARKASGDGVGQEKWPGGTLVDNFLDSPTSGLAASWVQ